MRTMILSLVLFAANLAYAQHAYPRRQAVRPGQAGHFRSQPNGYVRQPAPRPAYVHPGQYRAPVGPAYGRPMPYRYGAPYYQRHPGYGYYRQPYGYGYNRWPYNYGYGYYRWPYNYGYGYGQWPRYYFYGQSIQREVIYVEYPENSGVYYPLDANACRTDPRLCAVRTAPPAPGKIAPASQPTAAPAPAPPASAPADQTARCRIEKLRVVAARNSLVAGFFCKKVLALPAAEDDPDRRHVRGICQELVNRPHEEYPASAPALDGCEGLPALPAPPPR